MARIIQRVAVEGRCPVGQHLDKPPIRKKRLGLAAFDIIFEGAPREAVQSQLNVNLFGAMDVTRAILLHFRAHRAGTIINVSSGVGVFGPPIASIYSASKFALEGFSEGLWYELHSLGIE